jgi:hypothetical protein
MEKVLECSFYRNSKNIGMGLGLGFCDLDGGQTICNRDLNYCEKPSTLNNSQKQQNGNGKNRRKYPRVVLDLPLEYRLTSIPKAHGALVVNASEMGLLIESVKNIPVGTNLNIAVLFPKGYEMTNFEVSAEIVWKEIYWKEDGEGYQYGLKFIQISKEDHWRLRQLLSGRYNLDEIISNLKS